MAKNLIAVKRVQDDFFTIITNCCLPPTHKRVPLVVRFWHGEVCHGRIETGTELGSP